jgi:hypothetical protein
VSFDSASLFLDLLMHLVQGVEAPLLGVFVINLMYHASLVDSGRARLRVGLGSG